MAYCKADEVLDGIKDQMLNDILGDEYIEDLEERKRRLLPFAESAIEDADAEINGYVAKRYTVPLVPTPDILHKFSVDIAIYNLVSRRGIDESDREKTVLTRYQAAVKFLMGVAEGKLSLGIREESVQAAAATGFQVRSSARLFSRNSMEGW